MALIDGGCKARKETVGLPMTKRFLRNLVDSMNGLACGSLERKRGWTEMDGAKSPFWEPMLFVLGSKTLKGESLARLIRLQRCGSVLSG